MRTTLTPDHIMEVGMGFFASKTLLSAIELELFTVLGDSSLTASETTAHKQALIDSAFAALNDGGRFIAIENVIDDDRRHNTFGLLMSLNMLIELEGGFDYTGAQFDAWCRQAGFGHTEVVPLVGPGSAAIAYK